MKQVEALKIRQQDVEALADIDLQQLWDHAQAEFKTLTGEDLGQYTLSFGTRLEEQERKLLAIKSSKDDQVEMWESKGFLRKAFSQDTFERAKKIFAKVFRVIWRFSDFLCPIAEKIPLAGVGVSFLQKAIDLLIQTTREYRSIFIKAAELFEQVGFFSMRFEMLMDAERDGVKIHRKFIFFLNQIMVHTVECVALFISLTKEAGVGVSPWKRAVKQFFNTMATGDDGGVGKKLAKLQDLIDEEGRLSTALILTSVLRIHKDVVAVHGSVTTISDKLTVVQEMISEYGISLGPSRVEQLKALFHITQEPWNDTFLACAERCIPGTSAWLHNHQLFQTWVTAQPHHPQGLAIEAESNYGKTYLATTAITHLLPQPQEPDTHRAVAFYYVDKSSKEVTAGTVIRAIAYQLCTRSSRFHDLASPRIIDAIGTSQSPAANFAEKLWSIIVNVSIELADITCFVILDGLELMAEDHLQVLLKALASSNEANTTLRILLTSSARVLDMVDRIASHGVQNSFPRIALNTGFVDDSTYLNRSDLMLVAEAELLRCEYFSDGLDTPQMVENMAVVQNRLVDAVRGDYYLLRSQIREIRHLLSISDMKTVIDRAEQDREAAIKRQLSSLAVRVSKEDLFQLKDTLHFLAVLELLSAPMPQITVVEQYLHNGRVSAGPRTKVQSAYAGLFSIDPQNRLSLATDEITAYLLPDQELALRATSDFQPPQDLQLDAIKHFLRATFSQNILKDQGMDEDFFDSRTRLCSLSKFIIERNLAMANVVIRLIDCLTTIYTEDQQSKAKEQSQDLTALARVILPEIFLKIKLSMLDDDVRSHLGATTARLFFDEAVLNGFWPVETLPQVKATWGEDDQYFNAAYGIVHHPNVVHRLRETQQDRPLWATALQEMSEPSHLKLAVSELIAKRWLLGESFWSYNDIQAYFLWFTVVPSLGLVFGNVCEEPYDELRTKGWYTPPNWRKIEAWAKKRFHIIQTPFFDIQRAAVLCSLGGKNEVPLELLNQHCDTNWLADVWRAEAISYFDDFDDAFDAVEHSLDLMTKRGIDKDQTSKVYAFFLMCMAYWNRKHRNLAVRQKMIQINNLIPGAFSRKMWASSFVEAVRVSLDVGFNFFHKHYQSNNNIAILETFVRESSNNSMHIALGLVLASDPDGSRLRFLCEAYRSSIALCEDKQLMSPQETKSTKQRLNFWLGRLHLISKDQSHPNEAILCWEASIHEFLSEPAKRDLELIMPIATHLCSAYIQKVLAEPASLEAESIVSKVEHLHGVAGFSEEPVALKLRFRASLCLARIYIARNAPTKAHHILHDHAASAFAMLSQRKNQPLFSIGWLYLASILTVLRQDHKQTVWAWSKVKLHQRRRWFTNEYEAGSIQNGNPPLDPAIQVKIDAIKASEEYTFYDGEDSRMIDLNTPDKYYLPSFATMACEGRDCHSTSTEPSITRCEPLHLAVEITFQSDFNLAQRGGQGKRIPFRVCLDCMQYKLCVTCYTRLQEGTLSPTPCRPDHCAVFIPGSADQSLPYNVSDEDMVMLAEESKKWEIEFDWRIKPE